MSTYTITYQCGHSRTDICSHCAEDEDWISPERCPSCQLPRMPRFGRIPSLATGDDQEDDDNEDNDDEGSDRDDDPNDSDYTPENDDGDGSSFEDLGMFGKKLRIRAPSSAKDATTVSDPDQTRISPADREFVPHASRGEVVYTKPKVVIRRTRKLSKVAIFDEGDAEVAPKPLKAPVNFTEEKTLMESTGNRIKLPGSDAATDA